MNYKDKNSCWHVILERKFGSDLYSTKLNSKPGMLMGHCRLEQRVMLEDVTERRLRRQLKA